MYLLFVLTVFVVSVGAQEKHENLANKLFGDPQQKNEHAVCVKSECHPYTVMKGKENSPYEIRKWKDTKLASVFSTGLPYAKASAKNFAKLENYLNEGNKRHAKIQLVYPILTVFMMNGTVPVKNQYAMAVFIPKELEANPPAATKAADDVRINDEKGTEFYSIRVEDGESDFKSVRAAQEKLHEALVTDQRRFYYNYVYVLTYHSPLDAEKSGDTYVYYMQCPKRVKVCGS